MTAAIEAQALTVAVRSKKLIRDITLSIGAGETVALVGPNGAGKSTLLRTLAGELTPSAGAVRLRGHELKRYAPRELALQRAVLSQSVTVAFPFTVAEIVRMGAGERRGPAIEALIDAALAELDLEGFRERVIGTLSGGEQQRVHFARVLVQMACGEAAHGPGVMLLDEPTASLDLRHQLDLIAATRRRAARGMTVIAILHDLNLAVRLAKRIVVLARGAVVADGVPSHAITDAMLREVFGVDNAMNVVPDTGMPFVLPQRASKPAANRVKS